MRDPTTAIDKSEFALPLVIAVTGHRDLVADELPQIRTRVVALLQELQQTYPHNRITVMSPLAEGADMLVGEVAIELGLELLVPLPKPERAYLDDFTSEEAKARFAALCAQASHVFDLDYTIPPCPEGFETAEWTNAYPYANLGIFLCSHCHILLAIWDGKQSHKLGGTGHVVQFHQDDIMPGVTPKSAATQQMLVDDESDLVFHISCTRQRDLQHRKHKASEAEWSWFTKDREHPRSKELPAQHKIIFQRSAEFSEDAVKFAEQIEAEKYSLLNEAQAGELPAGATDINHLYCVADWLAMHYQKRTLRTLSITHVMAFLMGFMFILYSDAESYRGLLVAFLCFFAIAAGSQFITKRGSWHRKYLDYRTLAEGLRVQFYWAAAGVTSTHKWKFAHDSYLQSQNPEFGWIRNVMRVAGVLCDARPNKNPAGLSFAVNEWVGGPEQGQLAYFKRKADERIKRFELTERLGNISLITSVVTVFAFILIGSRLSPLAESAMTVLMGTTLLLYGVRQGYTYATATKELIKQYEFMLRIYDNAHRRLCEAKNADETLEILSTLGQSALDEHSDWILMHRERSVEEGEIWRMGS